MTAKVNPSLPEDEEHCMRAAAAASMVPTVHVTSSVPLTIVAKLLPLPALQDSAVEFAMERAHTETDSERTMGFASDVAVDA